MTDWDWEIKSVLYRRTRYFDKKEHFRRMLFWSSKYVNLRAFCWLLRVVFQSALNTILWWAQQMVVILHECVCGDQRVLTIQTSGTGDAAAPANRKAHDKKSSRTCKIYFFLKHVYLQLFNKIEGRLETRGGWRGRKPEWPVALGLGHSLPLRSPHPLIVLAVLVLVLSTTLASRAPQGHFI